MYTKARKSQSLKFSVVELHKILQRWCLGEYLILYQKDIKYCDIICHSFFNYVKNFVFFIDLYKNHILYGCHGNKYGKKNLYLSKI